MSDSVTPWTAACQTSLAINNGWILLKLISIESIIQSNHLIFVIPFSSRLQYFSSIRVFCSESFLHIRWPNNEVSPSASVFPMNIQDWFPVWLTSWISLLFKGISRVFSSTTVRKKASVLWCSAFFIVQLSLSIHEYKEDQSLDYMDLCWQGDVFAF